MIYAVNILETGDIEAVTAALVSLYGAENVSTPYPRTPRHLLVSAPEGQSETMNAIPGVCGCHDNDAPAELTLLESQDAGHWHIGAVSGLPHYEYGYLGQRPIYLGDVVPNVALVPNVEVIYNPGNAAGDHGTGTADILHRVAPFAPIFAAQCFNADGTGTTGTVNAGMNAIADHAEDNLRIRPAVASFSLSSSGGGNPYSAIMARMASLDILVCASSGNNGNNTSLFPVWPAGAADLSVGAHDANYVRADYSNHPADVHAGGGPCDFLIASGTTLSNVTGTSISCPIAAAALWRALDAGHDLTWLLDQSRTGLTNLPGGPDRILTYPTSEASTPPPPPPPPPAQEPNTVPTTTLKTLNHAALPNGGWARILFGNTIIDQGGWYNADGTIRPGAGYVDLAGYMGLPGGTAHDVRIRVLAADQTTQRDYVGHFSNGNAYGVPIAAQDIYLANADDVIVVEASVNAAGVVPSGRVSVHRIA